MSSNGLSIDKSTLIFLSIAGRLFESVGLNLEDVHRRVDAEVKTWQQALVEFNLLNRETGQRDLNSLFGLVRWILNEETNIDEKLTRLHKIVECGGSFHRLQRFRGCPEFNRPFRYRLPEDLISDHLRANQSEEIVADIIFPEKLASSWKNVALYRALRLIRPQITVWGHMFQETCRSRQEVQGHPCAIRHLEYPESSGLASNYFVTAGDDGFIKIWNSHDATLSVSLKRHLWDVSAILIIPELDFIVSGCSLGHLRTWALFNDHWKPGGTLCVQGKLLLIRHHLAINPSLNIDSQVRSEGNILAVTEHGQIVLIKLDELWNYVKPIGEGGKGAPPGAFYSGSNYISIINELPVNVKVEAADAVLLGEKLYVLVSFLEIFRLTQTPTSSQHLTGSATSPGPRARRRNLPIADGILSESYSLHVQSRMKHLKSKRGCPVRSTFTEKVVQFSVNNGNDHDQPSYVVHWLEPYGNAVVYEIDSDRLVAVYHLNHGPNAPTKFLVSGSTVAVISDDGFITTWEAPNFQTPQRTMNSELGSLRPPRTLETLHIPNTLQEPAAPVHSSNHGVLSEEILSSLGSLSRGRLTPLPPKSGGAECQIVTDAQWTCELGYMVIAESLLPHSLRTRSFQKLKSKTTGVCVLDCSSGKLLGKAMYTRTSMSMISILRPHPSVPTLTLVGLYGGNLLIVDCVKDLIIWSYNAYESEWTSAAWRPYDGTEVVACRQFGTFTVFSPFRGHATDTMIRVDPSCSADESILMTETEAEQRVRMGMSLMFPKSSRFRSTPLTQFMNLEFTPVVEVSYRLPPSVAQILARECTTPGDDTYEGQLFEPHYLRCCWQLHSECRIFCDDKCPHTQAILLPTPFTGFSLKNRTKPDSPSQAFVKQQLADFRALTDGLILDLHGILRTCTPISPTRPFSFPQYIGLAHGGPRLYFAAVTLPLDGDNRMDLTQQDLDYDESSSSEEEGPATPPEHRAEAMDLTSSSNLTTEQSDEGLSSESSENLQSRRIIEENSSSSSPVEISSLSSEESVRAIRRPRRYYVESLEDHDLTFERLYEQSESKIFGDCPFEHGNFEDLNLTAYGMMGRLAMLLILGNRDIFGENQVIKLVQHSIPVDVARVESSFSDLGKLVRNWVKKIFPRMDDPLWTSRQWQLIIENFEDEISCTHLHKVLDPCVEPECLLCRKTGCSRNQAAEFRIDELYLPDHTWTNIGGRQFLHQTIKNLASPTQPKSALIFMALERILEVFAKNRSQPSPLDMVGPLKPVGDNRLERFYMHRGCMESLVIKKLPYAFQSGPKRQFTMDDLNALLRSRGHTSRGRLTRAKRTTEPCLELDGSLLFSDCSVCGKDSAHLRCLICLTAFHYSCALQSLAIDPPFQPVEPVKIFSSREFLETSNCVVCEGCAAKTPWPLLTYGGNLVSARKPAKCRQKNIQLGEILRFQNRGTLTARGVPINSVGYGLVVKIESRFPSELKNCFETCFTAFKLDPEIARNLVKDHVPHSTQQSLPADLDRYMSEVIKSLNHISAEPMMQSLADVRSWFLILPPHDRACEIFYLDLPNGELLEEEMTTDIQSDNHQIQSKIASCSVVDMLEPRNFLANLSELPNLSEQIRGGGCDVYLKWKETVLYVRALTALMARPKGENPLRNFLTRLGPLTTFEAARKAFDELREDEDLSEIWLNTPKEFMWFLYPIPNPPESIIQRLPINLRPRTGRANLKPLPADVDPWLPDYVSQISAPICLNDILVQLISGKYRRNLGIYSDISQIYENSVAFNGQIDEVTDNALSLKQQFFRLIKSPKLILPSQTLKLQVIASDVYSYAVPTNEFQLVKLGLISVEDATELLNASLELMTKIETPNTSPATRRRRDSSSSASRPITRKRGRKDKSVV